MMCGSKFRTGRYPDALHSASPGVQVLAALAVLVPVALSGLALVVLAPGLWWIFTTYFWLAFPAFGLLLRGVAGLSDGAAARARVGHDRERELLGALREHGELTPAGAAMETSLTVAEADEMLRGLAEGGHLEVRVRGGGLSYALWEAPSRGEGQVKSGAASNGEPRLTLLETGEDGAREGRERSGA